MAALDKKRLYEIAKYMAEESTVTLFRKPEIKNG
jgi:hypothetical protein